jgi:site-specific DNA-methyltransferase (adenine-specific)
VTTNRLVHGDALAALAGALAPGHRAQLAYLDPPFAVGVAFGARTKPLETRAQSGAASGPIAYDDRWESLEAYLVWLEPRLAAARDLLATNGSLWLHLDHRAVHNAKVMCDRIFGAAHFIGEIIWMPGNGAKSRRGPGMTHQTLLIYGKGREILWNADDPALREPYAKTSLAMHFQNIDASGRAYRERTVGAKTYRYYADQGRALGSVWSDCPSMVANTPLRRETTGYPTQKPRTLLDRIVRATTEIGALVIDPFCGSGTTLESAALLGRSFFGSDVGALAVETTTKRLAAAGIAFERGSVSEDATWRAP